MEKPIVHSLVLCDLCITEKDTEKWSLIGIFHKFFSNKFPCVAKFHAVSFISGALGLHNVEIRLVHVLTQATVSKVNTQIKFHDKVCVNKIDCRMEVKLAQPGPYEIQMLSDSEFLKTVKLDVFVLREIQNGPT